MASPPVPGKKTRVSKHIISLERCPRDRDPTHTALTKGEDAVREAVRVSTDCADLQDAGETPAIKEDCLRQVNKIAFVFAVSLSDGDCASGTLWLDDVALRF